MKNSTLIKRLDAIIAKAERLNDADEVEGLLKTLRTEVVECHDDYTTFLRKWNATIVCEEPPERLEPWARQFSEEAEALLAKS